MAREAIFIGYRRDDTADVAGRIYDSLARRFGRNRVFKDVDSLHPGADFAEHIQQILPRCRVMLVLIGPNWLDSRDPEGRRRLDDQKDFVRTEIETGLAARGLYVVPVLVNGARMPLEEHLPESLRPLVRLHAATVRRDPDFHDDVSRLAGTLRRGKLSASYGAPIGERASKGAMALLRRATPRTPAGLAILAAVGLALILTIATADLLMRMPSTGDVWEAVGAPSVTMLDRQGNVILRENADASPPVDTSALPPYVPQAFIAIEDPNFYGNLGFGFTDSSITEDLTRVIRASSPRLQADHWTPHLFQDVVLTVWVEANFTKDEILSLYLSRVSFGRGLWGVDASSERYFDRPARELTLLQTATLAGAVRAGSPLNLLTEQEEAATRARLVLERLVTYGFISQTEADAALREELMVSRDDPSGVLRDFRAWIDPLLSEVIGDRRDDFIVETTIEIASQREAAESVDAVLANSAENGALFALDDEGGVRALVGGRQSAEAAQTALDRVFQRRQPGSAFAFFVYTTAMERGLTPGTVRTDAPIRVGSWTAPRRGRSFQGTVSLVQAYGRELDSVTLVVANEVGPDTVIGTARRLGVQSTLQNSPFLGLGTDPMSLSKLTVAHSMIAAGGYRVEPHGVERIRRASTNEVVWSYRGARARAVDDGVVQRMNTILMASMAQQGIELEGREIAGTSGGSASGDAWVIGYSPGLTAGVWVGTDDTTVSRQPRNQASREIWTRFMGVALTNIPIRGINRSALAPASDPVARTPSVATDRSLDFGPEG
jgi:penicillin-binding protein 1A